MHSRHYLSRLGNHSGSRQIAFHLIWNLHWMRIVLVLVLDCKLVSGSCLLLFGGWPCLLFSLFLIFFLESVGSILFVCTFFSFFSASLGWSSLSWLGLSCGSCRSRYVLGYSSLVGLFFRACVTEQWYYCWATSSPITSTMHHYPLWPTSNS